MKEKQETVSHENCINTAFLHYNCSSVDSSLSKSSESLQAFFRPPNPMPVYIPLQVNTISNRYGGLLSAGVMGLDTPLLVTGRHTHGIEKGLALV